MAKSKNPTYTADDFVEAVDADGQPLDHPIPKSWIGTDLVAEGVKEKGKARSSKSTKPDPTIEPAGNASRDDWEAYARTAKGATDADIVDEKGEALSRDDLKEKYSTPAS